MSVDLLTVDFRTVNRDELRRLARLNNVQGLTHGGRPLTASGASKDELVRGFLKARSEGKFGEAGKSTNVTVKQARTWVFLKGKGCDGRWDAHVGIEVQPGGKLVVHNEYGPEDVGEDLDAYEKFHTTLADLKAAVAAIEANA